MADLGHRETDERLNRLERRIMREYQRASKEILKKTQEFMRQFQKEDDRMRTLVAEGKITDSQYKKWRIENILTGRRWNKMRKTLVEDWFNADKIARRMVNDEKVDVYALNHNYAAYQIEHDIRMNTSFTLYNHESVERLLRDNPKILPPPGKKVAKDIAEGRAKQWSEKKIQSVMAQSILQGDSVPNIAKRLTQEMGEMSKNAAIRNARTLITGAEAAGRVDAYKQAKDMGIDMKQMWLSTLDGRTRHEHRLLDGQKVEVDKPFKVDGVEIRFPGDPTAPGYLIYNCRCTIVGVVKGSDLDLEGLEGMERDDRLGNMSYEEWKEEKAKQGKKEDREESIYDKIGQYPKRPRLDDFDGDYDALDAARQEYRERRRNVEEGIGEWFDENYGQKTISDQEFADWCTKNGVVQRGSLEGLDRSALKAYTERYEQLISDFPQVKEWHNQLGAPFEISFTSSGVVYDAEASFGMDFGPRFSNFRGLTVSSYDSDTNGFFVRGENPAVRIFDHEFGHQVYHALESPPKMDLTREELEAKIAFKNDFVQSVYKKSGMSEYATKNDDELFAEAFAAWYGGEKTDFANAMGDFLRRHGAI